MATLSGNKIKDTYQSLIKLTDNGNLTTGAKQITDGFGNNSPLYLSTTQIGLGVTPTVQFHASGDGKFGGNLTVIGNLVVEGSTTTVGTDTLTVKDPLIVLANNNTSSDAVDIGFYGKYRPSSTTLFAGLFRDAGDDKFKLFKSLQVEPTTTVNTSGTGYAVATLVADVEGTLTGVIASTTTATTQSANNNSTKVATTAYVDNSVGNYLPLAGGTMSGNIAMGGNDISNVGDITIDNININGNTITSTSADFIVDSNGGNIILDSSGGDIVLKDTGTEFGRLKRTGENLIIKSITNDKDIIFKGVDNSSEITALTLDMSEGGNATFGGDITVSGGDITLSGTGRIQGIDTVSASTDAASKGYVDSKFQETDTLAEVLALGNTTGGTDIAVTTGDDITFTDSSIARFGTDNDFNIYHNGTNAFIKNATGTLYITNTGTDQDIWLQSDDGSGGETPYVKIDGSSGAVELNHYGTKKFETTSTGAKVTGSNFNVFAASGATKLEFGQTNGNWKIEAGNSGNNTLIIGSVSNATDNITLDTTNGGSATFAGNIIAKAGTIQVNRSDDQSQYGIFGQDSSGGYIQFHRPAGSGLYENFRFIASNNDGQVERMRIDTSGNLSLATATSLDFNVADFAQIKFKESGAITIDSDNNQSSRNFQFKDGDGSSLMFIGDDGNVGVGTTSPSYKLDVSGEINATTRYRKNGYEIVGQNSTELRLANASYWQTLALYTNGSPKLTIDSSGNVGIGTTSPSAKLDVSGTINIASDGSTGFTNSRLILNSTQDAARGAGVFMHNTNDDQEWYAGVPYNDGFDSYVIGHKSTASHADSTSELANALLTVKSAGNVGIGTDSPSSYNSRGRNLVVNSSGDTGITIAAGSSDSSTLLFADGTGGTAGYRGIIEYDHSTDSMEFSTAATERMRITSAGNVGIGTTSPDTLLNLEGAADTSIITLGCTKNDASWSGERIGGINFHSNDGSGPGASVRGSINYVAMSSSGGSTGFTFKTGDNSERMVIDNSGDIKFSNYGAGTLVTDSSGNITASSDSSLKTKVDKKISGLDEILKLQPRAYYWNKDEKKNIEFGFFADEVKDIIPEAAPLHKDKTYGLIDRGIIAALVNSIQELEQRIKQLENK